MGRHSVAAFVAIDLSSAFNTVDHDVLINVFKTKFGINSSALDWFSTYLRLRWFKVKIGEKFSSNKKLTFSISQSSCASVNVFTAYSSTLSDVVPCQLSINGFADDHSIKRSFIQTIKRIRLTL